MATGQFNAWEPYNGPCISSMEEKKYSLSLHAMETEISSGLMDYLACMQTLPYLLHSVTYTIIVHQSVKHDCVYYSS